MSSSSVSASGRVLIVGAGPTGLAAANLLGQAGVPVSLIEQHATTSDEAKAISLDDESLRTMQAAGWDDKVAEVVTPGTGTRYYDRRGRPLLHAKGPFPFRLGHPFKNAFAQPDLERVLLDGLDRFPHVEVAFETTLIGLRPGADRVEATIVRRSGRGGPDGAAGSETLPFAYVLGCDGGRSAVRELRGITMSGRNHEEKWLVVDTLGDQRDERFAMHYGDPGRPHVIVPGRGNRCRYEFALRPDEADLGQVVDFELIRRLLAPFRAIEPHHVERAVVYRFNALVADTWGSGRCFLLGDAAHMMPPFAGQGLNSGVRDAANLCWKLVAVLSGTAGPALLDSYEVERKPHALATVRLSERLGTVVMTRNRWTARARDAAVRLLKLFPGTRDYLEAMRFRPVARYQQGFVHVTGRDAQRDLVGVQLPQPRVYTGDYELVRMDDALGPGFSLLGVDVAEAEWAGLDPRLEGLAPRRIEVALGDRMPRAAPGRRACTDADGRLEGFFRGMSGHFVLVRPDRFIAAVFTAAQSGRVMGELAPFLDTRSRGLGLIGHPPEHTSSGIEENVT
ncbi:FAD-dependent monooxygenase [Actinomadura scrupuli]|uniref:FAD-dependent monooxygenase n=1 Tax=Actinomadura scrupuli TaxID=559629 RepID=UPI003D9754C2